jgi:Rps23 Pro-64 3,4-dihydroxylase Tpa1-like proline 4-hydroxylase
MQHVLNPSLAEHAPSLATQFRSARPFRHVVLKDFLATSFLESVIRAFPEPVEADMISEFGDRSLKHTVEDIPGLGEPFVAWDAFLQSRDFIGWLETVTGIKGLIFDPEYIGAGTHNNFHGQSLDMHIDFNRHPLTGLHRRLNLIVYLCPEWDPCWGGCLTLQKNPWDRHADQQEKIFLPISNQAVLFETTEHSWHGFNRLNLPEDKRHLSRKSLTVYYYSGNREQSEIAEEHSTIYVPGWIPESVKPGVVLSEEAYKDLETVMFRRDHYLQIMYRREREAINRARGAFRGLVLMHRLAKWVRLLTFWRYWRRDR